MSVADLAMRTSVVSWYRRIRRMNGWKNPDVVTWQNEQLEKLIIHFYENTLYYKNLLDSLGIDPYKVKSIDDLKRIPPLTKKTIREHFDELTPKNLKRIPFKYAATGGSTGDPLKFTLDLNSWSYTTASNIYSFEQKGLLYGDKYIALGSSSLFPVDEKSRLHSLYYSLRKKLPMSGINMSDEVMEKQVDYILKNRIEYIYGYASAIFLLAKFVKSGNLNVKLKACFPTSEILTDDYRKQIEEAFHCIVMDGYGARDGGITADELTAGYYHVGYNSLAEVIDCYTENTGKLLVTDLLNYAFPFIRYEIGDEVTLVPGNLPFYNGQVFSKILGRESNVIHLENGHNLTGPGFTILFKDLNVIAYKIYKTGSLRIKIDILPDKKYSMEEEKFILDTMKKQAGDNCEVIIEYFEKFDSEKSGKRNYFFN
jgi:phenylacetate-CoA ligase